MKYFVYIIVSIVFLVKCSDMEIKWVKKFEPAGKGNYRINGIASLRKQGYVIVSTFWSTDKNPICITASYDENGELIWHTAYETNDKVATKAIAVRATPSGLIEVAHDIFVLARTTDLTGEDRIVLIKYDSLGNMQWDKVIERLKGAVTSKLLSDHLNNIYIAGWTIQATDPANIFIAKYRPSGELVWTIYSRAPSIYLDSLSFALNNKDQFLVAGCLTDNEDFFYTVYDSLGQQIKEKKCATAIQEISLTDAQIDDHGNVYLLGTSYSDSSGSDYIITVYDKSDSLIFEESYDGPAHLEDIATAMIVDELSPESLCIYIIGSSENEDTLNEVCSVKYDITGNELWIKTLKGRKNEPAEPNLCGPSTLPPRTPQDNEHFYLAGSMGDDVFILKHSTRGFITWFIRYSTPHAVNRVAALSGFCLGLESRTESTVNAYILKYGKAEQLGIIRWD
jgi:hypothetical protein